MTDSGERDPATWPLGQRLRKARGTLSLDKVAEMSGVKRETIRSYENGYRADNRKPVNPRPTTLRPLAEALGIPVREAFDLAKIDPRHLRPHELEPAKPSSRLMAKIERVGDPAVLSALEVLVDRVLRADGFIAPDAPRPGEEREGEHLPAVGSDPRPAAHPVAHAVSEFGDPFVSAPDPDRTG